MCISYENVIFSKEEFELAVHEADTSLLLLYDAAFQLATHSCSRQELVMDI